VTEVRWGQNFGFLNARQTWGFQRQHNKFARGAPKGKPCWQEEHPTNKTERASGIGAVGKNIGVSRMQGKLGVSRGNARQAGKRGAQPTKPRSQRHNSHLGRNLGFPKANANMGFHYGTPRRVEKIGAQRHGKRGNAILQDGRPTNKTEEPATQLMWEKNWGFQKTRKGELARWARKGKESWQVGCAKARRLGRTGAHKKSGVGKMGAQRQGMLESWACKG
jgi:hypothetical protein